MPQLAPLVLKDRAATPVDHTFQPRDIKSGVGTLVETSGVPVGASRYSISLSQTTTGRYKATLKLARPILVTETINGVAVPKVVRTGYVDVNFTFDETSTEQERKDLVGMIQDSLATTKTLVNDVVVGLQAVY